MSYRLDRFISQRLWDRDGLIREDGGRNREAASCIDKQLTYGSTIEARQNEVNLFWKCGYWRRLKTESTPVFVGDSGIGPLWHL